MTLQKLEQLHEQFILTAAVKPVGTQAYIKIIFEVFTTRDEKICRTEFREEPVPGLVYSSVSFSRKGRS